MKLTPVEYMTKMQEMDKRIHEVARYDIRLSQQLRKDLKDLHWHFQAIELEGGITHE